MPHPPRLDVLLPGALVLLVLGLGVRWWSERDGLASGPVPGVDARAPAPAIAGAPVAVDRAPRERLVVHVTGAVRSPGVFRLPAGARVQDALERAGGVRRGADTQAINLAARLTDGRQVVVPRRVPRRAGTVPPSGDPAAGTGAPAGPVSLSTATEAELDTLDGVGPATARKIVEYRTANGGFGSVEELAEIPGIGPKRLESLRAQVTP